MIRLSSRFSLLVNLGSLKDYPDSLPFFSVFMLLEELKLVQSEELYELVGSFYEATGGSKLDADLCCLAVLGAWFFGVSCSFFSKIGVRVFVDFRRF